VYTEANEQKLNGSLEVRGYPSSTLTAILVELH